MPNTEKMREIERVASEYRIARDRLSGRLDQVQAEIDTITRLALHDLRAYASQAAAIHAELAELIQSNPEAWTRPRTRVYSGIKCGLRQAAEKLVAPVPEATVQAIRERHPDQEAALIKIKEAPVLSALAGWDEEALAEIHIHVTPSRDVVVIQDAYTDLEKVLQKMLGDDIETLANGNV